MIDISKFENITKGPWRLGVYRDCCDEYSCVLEPIGLQLYDSMKDEDCEAIAAVPDMIEELDRLYKFIEMLYGSTTDALGKEQSSIWDLLEAEIKSWEKK